jgi:hypothetical protein
MYIIKGLIIAFLLILLFVMFLPIIILWNIGTKIKWEEVKKLYSMWFNND